MKPKLNNIYKKLYSYFGRQGWWPAESPFEVMVGAILTQNTNWVNVEKAIARLKADNLLDAKRLYNLPHNKLASLIMCSGYYNIKARRLKSFLRLFVKSYGADPAKMSQGKLKDLRLELLSVNGIGPETADSILLYALNKPIFVVDAYTRRMLLCQRMIRAEDKYDDIQNLFMRNLKADVKLFNEFHALVVKLAKEFCRKNKPKCDRCPLNPQLKI